MSTRVDVEEIQTTKSEKLLAAVLVVFLLVGGIWTYQKIDDYVADAIDIDYSYRGSVEDRAVLDGASRARQRVAQATAARADAREDLEIGRAHV